MTTRSCDNQIYISIHIKKCYLFRYISILNFSRRHIRLSILGCLGDLDNATLSKWRYRKNVNLILDIKSVTQSHSLWAFAVHETFRRFPNLGDLIGSTISDCRDIATLNDSSVWTGNTQAGFVTSDSTTFWYFLKISLFRLYRTFRIFHNTSVPLQMVLDDIVYLFSPWWISSEDSNSLSRFSSTYILFLYLEYAFLSRTPSLYALFW